MARGTRQRQVFDGALDIVVSPALCGAAERRRVFRKKAGRLSERSEFLPAPENPPAQGKPKAKPPGAVLLVLFLPPRKVHGKTGREKLLLLVKIASLSARNDVFK
ncbi:MAG: hypothetical protein ACOZBW_07870 [Thermodesulfobacteriota bacterium]